MGEASRPAPVARVDDDPAAQALAVRVVLARYADEGWTKAEALQVLQMLGLQPYEAGARTDALGRREVTARSVRRRKSRAAERACAVETAVSGETGAERLNGAHRPNQPQEEADSGHVPHHDDERTRLMALKLIEEAVHEEWADSSLDRETIVAVARAINETMLLIGLGETPRWTAARIREETHMAVNSVLGRLDRIAKARGSS